MEAARLRAVEPVIPVHLELRPKQLTEAILKGDVGLQLSANGVFVRGRYD
jgi:hypothetical protein